MLDARATGMPTILHWGLDLGALGENALTSLADAVIPAVSPSSIDVPLRAGILPLESAGWAGRPGLAGSRGDQTLSPSFILTDIHATEHSIDLRLEDGTTGLTVTTSIRLGDTGVLEIQHTVSNTGSTSAMITSLLVTLPLPSRARELLDFSGRWSFERRPQRHEFQHGIISRQTRHGRPGHDSPFLFAAGTESFSFRSGEVWALHLAWSGDQDLLAESQPTGHRTIAAGELLAPAEIVLAPGESYSSPVVLGSWSNAGLDGVGERFHRWVRGRRTVPLPPRPVILNTWEAVYFDHDVDRLLALADTAASVGVERFVLDDGWMTGRTDDTRALGDWTVDSIRWPNGLHPLIERVTALGMQFGLWVEPEMVSLDSDLAREHPDWVLRGDPNRLPQPWRHQYVLDLDNPAAFEDILGQLSALLDEYPIRYLKWDQNRDLLGGSAHRQTTATWRLLDELGRRYPGVEIESCSSGGARVDLGILERTDRIWASDTNDPLERQAIQRWTSLVVPPELVGSHLGAPTAHTTGRSSELSFRLATALFVSAGIEWDLARATPDDLAAITHWITLYKALRAELHSGTTVHVDSPDPGIEVHGVVTPDRRGAVLAFVCVAAPRDAIPGSLVFPGLDPALQYRCDVVDGFGSARTIQDAPPPWFAVGSVTLSGRMIAEVGFAVPALAPQQAIIFRVTALEKS